MSVCVVGLCGLPGFSLGRLSRVGSMGQGQLGRQVSDSISCTYLQVRVN